MIGAAASRPPFPVTFNNWQSAEQIGWTFQHINEIFPTHEISRGTSPSVTLPVTQQDVDELEVNCADGRRSTVAQVMADTDTDGWMVLHHNTVIAEHYPEPSRPGSQMQPGTAHLLMSVSKSIVGTVIGSLVAQGVIDLHKPLEHYIPRFSGSGYEGATIRHLLDMRSGIRFSEDYLDPRAEVRVLEQAFYWAPPVLPDPPMTLRRFLLTLSRDRPHGGVFDYRSCETDVLGWVCEEATGRPFAKLASALVWSKLGVEFDANIVVDAEGSGFFDGGISAAMGDLARFGAMYAGRGRALTESEVLPAWWVEDCLVGDPDSRTAFAHGPGDNRMPGGMYRNQFWLPYPDRPLLVCLGIHGQMVYIDLAADVVAVKLSCWPAPQDAWKLFSTFSAFGAITSAVSAP